MPPVAIPVSPLTQNEKVFAGVLCARSGSKSVLSGANVRFGADFEKEEAKWSYERVVKELYKGKGDEKRFAEFLCKVSTGLAEGRNGEHTEDILNATINGPVGAPAAAGEHLPQGYTEDDFQELVREVKNKSVFGWMYEKEIAAPGSQGDNANDAEKRAIVEAQLEYLVESAAKSKDIQKDSPELAQRLKTNLVMLKSRKREEAARQNREAFAEISAFGSLPIPSSMNEAVKALTKAGAESEANQESMLRSMEEDFAKSKKTSVFYRREDYIDKALESLQSHNPRAYCFARVLLARNIGFLSNVCRAIEDPADRSRVEAAAKKVEADTIAQGVRDLPEYDTQAHKDERDKKIPRIAARAQIAAATMVLRVASDLHAGVIIGDAIAHGQADQDLIGRVFTGFGENILARPADETAVRLAAAAEARRLGAAEDRMQRAAEKAKNMYNFARSTDFSEDKLVREDVAMIAAQAVVTNNNRKDEDILDASAKAANAAKTAASTAVAAVVVGGGVRAIPQNSNAEKIIVRAAALTAAKNKATNGSTDDSARNAGAAVTTAAMNAINAEWNVVLDGHAPLIAAAVGGGIADADLDLVNQAGAVVAAVSQSMGDVNVDNVRNAAYVRMIDAIHGDAAAGRAPRRAQEVVDEEISRAHARLTGTTTAVRKFEAALSSYNSARRKVNDAENAAINLADYCRENDVKLEPSLDEPMRFNRPDTVTFNPSSSENFPKEILAVGNFKVDGDDPDIKFTKQGDTVTGITICKSKRITKDQAKELLRKMTKEWGEFTMSGGSFASRQVFFEAAKEMLTDGEECGLIAEKMSIWHPFQRSKDSQLIDEINTLKQNRAVHAARADTLRQGLAGAVSQEDKQKASDGVVQANPTAVLPMAYNLRASVDQLRKDLDKLTRLVSIADLNPLECSAIQGRLLRAGEEVTEAMPLAQWKEAACRALARETGNEAHLVVSAARDKATSKFLDKIVGMSELKAADKTAMKEEDDKVKEARDALGKVNSCVNEAARYIPAAGGATEAQAKAMVLQAVLSMQQALPVNIRNKDEINNILEGIRADVGNAAINLAALQLKVIELRDRLMAEGVITVAGGGNWAAPAAGAGVPYSAQIVNLGNAVRVIALADVGAVHNAMIPLRDAVRSDVDRMMTATEARDKIVASVEMAGKVDEFEKMLVARDEFKVVSEFAKVEKLFATRGIRMNETIPLADFKTHAAAIILGMVATLRAALPAAIAALPDVNTALQAVEDAARRNNLANVQDRWDAVRQQLQNAGILTGGVWNAVRADADHIDGEIAALGQAVNTVMVEAAKGHGVAAAADNSNLLLELSGRAGHDLVRKKLQITQLSPETFRTNAKDAALHAIYILRRFIPRSSLDANPDLVRALNEVEKAANQTREDDHAGFGDLEIRINALQPLIDAHHIPDAYVRDVITDILDGLVHIVHSARNAHLAAGAETRLARIQELVNRLSSVSRSMLIGATAADVENKVNAFVTKLSTAQRELRVAFKAHEVATLLRERRMVDAHGAAIDHVPIADFRTSAFAITPAMIATMREALAGIVPPPANLAAINNTLQIVENAARANNVGAVQDAWNVLRGFLHGAGILTAAAVWTADGAADDNIRAEVAALGNAFNAVLGVAGGHGDVNTGTLVALRNAVTSLAARAQELSPLTILDFRAHARDAAIHALYTVRNYIPPRYLSDDIVQALINAERAADQAHNAADFHTLHDNVTALQDLNNVAHIPDEAIRNKVTGILNPLRDLAIRAFDHDLDPGAVDLAHRTNPVLITDVANAVHDLSRSDRMQVISVVNRLASRAAVMTAVEERLFLRKAIELFKDHPEDVANFPSTAATKLREVLDSDLSLKSGCQALYDALAAKAAAHGAGAGPRIPGGGFGHP